ncbi:hypothetical protein PC9H_003290 [Pleurotus ostreatus]|uniref:Uncharacterized protein n=2 Tax=Pleurotus TaxID=5320 RepID=A0A8H7A1L5_PLEOS|nr:uncharacterized protein PC9H_003290 [Pleurotus ostreatus]KAF7436457.1 hypothetical protein PC9H_003290 [Pleurotus ostreatus]KAG9222462.1 hypothetical protein CCMSSC00406_0002797 [Pleurotus cornucopiae]
MQARWPLSVLCLIFLQLCYVNALVAKEPKRRGLFGNAFEFDEDREHTTIAAATRSTTPSATPTTTGILGDIFLTTTHSASGSLSAGHTKETDSIRSYSVLGTPPPPKPVSVSATPLSPISSPPAETTEAPPEVPAPTPGSTLTTSNAELAQWKVLGVTVLCIAVVAAIILSVMFFDTWWGFVRDVFLGKKRREAAEELVPDWEKRSWELRMVSEDGHRYPSLSSVESITKWKGMKGGKKTPAETTTEKPDLELPMPTYRPDYNPYALHSPPSSKP